MPRLFLDRDIIWLFSPHCLFLSDKHNYTKCNLIFLTPLWFQCFVYFKSSKFKIFRIFKHNSFISSPPDNHTDLNLPAITRKKTLVQGRDWKEQQQSSSWQEGTNLLEKGQPCQRWRQWWRPSAQCGIWHHGGDCVLLLSFSHEEPFFSCCLALLMVVSQRGKVQQVVSSCYSSNITVLNNRESKNIHQNFRPLSTTVIFNSSKPTAIKSSQVIQIKCSRQIQCIVIPFA